MRTSISVLLLAIVPGWASGPQGHSLPLAFIPNAGQADASVRFMIQTPDLRAGFTAGGVMFQLQGKQQWLRFRESNPTPELVGQAAQSGRANFILGNRRYVDLPLFSQILYRDLYPGIDLSYCAAGERIKSEFVVTAGGDPKRIRLEYPAARLSIEANGDLHRGLAEFRKD